MTPDGDGLGACELLARAAKEVYLIVLLNSIKQRERVTGEVATKLGQIAQESFLGYEVDGETEEAAASLLRELLRFCTFPIPIQHEITPEAAFLRIVALLRPENKTKLTQSVFYFFKNDGSANRANGHCDEFLARLNAGDPNDKTTLDQMKGGTGIPEPNHYPRHVSENLFNVLHQHTCCRSFQLHQRQKSQLLRGDKLSPVRGDSCSHPARLYLDATSPIQSKHAQFEIVVSTTEMSYWQDLWIGVPMQIKRQHRMVGFQGVSGDEDEDEDEEEVLSSHDQLGSDYFCQVLQHPLFARIKVQFVHEVGLVSFPPPAPLERFLCPGQGLPLCIAVQSHTMTDKDKISLAHAIAHSFWQFYGSDLMQEKWTSHDIWFMYETDETDVKLSPRERLALRAYMSLNFDGENSISERLDNPMITHPFPHILALGIILLEIGLRRPFRKMKHLPLVSQLNWEHGAAKQLLNELERGDWVRSTQKDVFTKVVANCLDPSIFAITPGPKLKEAKGSKMDARAVKTPYNNNGEAQVDERRRRLYNKTVEPLARLVKIAFKQDPRYVSYLSRCKDAVETDKQLYPQVASFHVGKTIVPREWLNNLKHISAHIKKLQSQIPGRIFTPVRIAILDTGYDDTLEFFKQMGRKASIGGWKDYVGNSEISDHHTTKRRDDYGHGSLMARLVMESAPLARVYIARVAKDTHDLSFDAERISKAIRWAGIEEEVDIISLSFGFPDHDEKIAKAIEDVASQRNVIFFASAGNNAKHQDETFPARHRLVMSIRATNYAGTFSESNPPLDDDCITPVLGTFGGDLPDNIRNEISRRFGPDICQPGSSIATAVAAGIAASTIAYAEVLSAVLRIPTAEDPVQSLKSTEGMRRMLKKMVPDKTGTHRFVNPIWFWSEEAGAWKAWAAICNSVSKLMRQQRETSRRGI